MMKKFCFLLIFASLVFILGYGTSAFATGHLTVSNIGSSGEDGVSAKTVPPWIKTSMQYWVEGHTSDTEFLNAVEFLANENIIRVEDDIRTDITIEAKQKNGTTGTFDTEILSMDLSGMDSFFDVFYESYTVDSFFDIWTELQESTDSFFDVFFEVETPRTNECLRGQELVFDKQTSRWKCATADTVDSFFDVFFDVTTDTAQNTRDIDELERKISVLEKKIAELESKNTSTRPAT